MTAPLESIEVHSKDIFIKYISVSSNELLSWQIKPIKKSIVYAIWRVPPGRDGFTRPKQVKPANTQQLQEKLQGAGLESVTPWVKAEAGATKKGSFEVTIGSMYALVFDNTFSVSLSKTVFLVLSVTPIKHVKLVDPHAQFSGILLKKRRKKLQGYARRYFVLNSKTGELGYYVQPNSVHLRGSIPLLPHLAAVNVDPKKRAFVIDSGAEIWELRAKDNKDFEAWREQIEAVRKKVHFSNTHRASIDQEKSGSFARIKALKQDIALTRAEVERREMEKEKERGRNKTNASSEELSTTLRRYEHELSAVLEEMLREKAPSIAGTDYFDAFDAESGVHVLSDVYSSEEEIEISEYDDSSSESELGIPRRSTLPVPITIPPPSFMSFIRRNIGKDLSQVAMPVVMNEPTGLLQRFAEELEYAYLLNHAATSTTTPSILLVAAYCVSGLSNVRHRQRVARKSYTPLLGETFELIRDDLGFRLLLEKVSHRPQIYAMHAESEEFTLSSTPMPKQQFWGKSFEILTRGVVKIKLHRTGETFTYTRPSSFVRNIHMGEKYIEPSGSTIIKNNTTGERAIITYKASKSVFSKRSEDVEVHAQDSDGNVMALMTGKWTECLDFGGKIVWSVGDLVADPDRYCGMTLFSAQLNEITSLEEGKVCPTDTRLRPDQRLHEDGNLEEAEKVKLKLEADQRNRRNGPPHTPKWFTKNDKCDDEEWEIREGDEGYWAMRAKGFEEGLKLW